MGSGSLRMGIVKQWIEPLFLGLTRLGISTGMTSTPFLSSSLIPSSLPGPEAQMTLPSCSTITAARI